MTEIQLPIHQGHQKGMNGKFLPKNTLEIRGGGVGTNTGASNQNELSKTLNSNSLNSGVNTGVNASTKKSVNKLLEKTPSNLAILRLNSNTEKLDSFSAIVSVNFIDVKSNNNNNNNTTTNNNNNNRKSYDLKRHSTNIESSLTSFNSQTNQNNTNLNRMNTLASTSTISNNYSSSNNHHSSSNPSSNHVNHSHHHHSHNWHDESNSGWTSTGVMSDRSSVYSIDDGDFDREASRKVNNQLREIESILYERNSTHSSNLIECNEWLEKFPHLRILGNQIPNWSRDEHSSSDILKSSVPSVPSSFRNISSSFTAASTLTALTPLTSSQQLNKLVTDSNDSTLLNTNQLISGNNDPTAPPSFSNYKFFRRRENTELNNQGLFLNGTSMSICKISNNDLLTANACEDMEEEIFEQEGVYEELLAYDNQEEEYLFEHNKRLNINKRRRHGLPPITPKASMKDLVGYFLFNHMWSDLIDWSSNIIKSYAKTITDGDFKSDSIVSQKTPTPNLSTHSIENNQNTEITDNKSQKIVFPEISSSLSSYQQINSSTSTNLINNTNSLLNPTSNIATTLTKANVIQLKPFDTHLHGINLSNIQSGNSYPFYSAITDKSSINNGMLSRDNSTLNTQKLFANENMFDNKYSNGSNNENQDVVFDGLLKIKQINRTGVNNVNTTKSLAPLMPQSRVGSGNRRQLNPKKRYSSIEMSSNNLMDKNMSIHGAALPKPTSLNQLNEQVVPNHPNNNHNSFLPLTSNVNSGLSSIHSNPNLLNNRSNNNSSQAYHVNHNDEGVFENEYSEYPFNAYNNENAIESSIDEINFKLIHNTANNNCSSSNIANNNNNNGANSNNKLYYYGGGNSHYQNHGHFNNHYPYHYHYSNNNQSNNNNQNYGNYQPLPPIENALTFKPLRISSANNLKQNKEKTDRPLTSTATRFDTNLALHKRSTTPSGLASGNKASLANLYQTTNMKITGIRLSADDPLYNNNPNNTNNNNTSINQNSLNSLANFLSTKSFASINSNTNNVNTNMSNANNIPNNSISTTPVSQLQNNNVNRRNSIKDTQNLMRSHK